MAVRPPPLPPALPTKIPKIDENPATGKQQQENQISIAPVGPRRRKRTRQEQDSEECTVYCNPRIAVPEKKQTTKQSKPIANSSSSAFQSVAPRSNVVEGI